MDRQTLPAIPRETSEAASGDATVARKRDPHLLITLEGQIDEEEYFQYIAMLMGDFIVRTKELLPAFNKISAEQGHSLVALVQYLRLPHKY